MNIPIHSTVDIVTNSSSEIFTNAKDGSDKELKKIINAIIASCGGTGTADDLFEIKTVIIYEDYYNPKNDKYERVEYDIDSKEGKKMRNGEGFYNVCIKVTPKDKDNKYAVEAANLLSKLEDLFESEERLC